MKMEKTECSETSEYKIQTPRNYPEENIQHTEHGESLKTRIPIIFGVVHVQNIVIVYTQVGSHTSLENKKKKMSTSISL
jgi:hypothetical protein